MRYSYSNNFNPPAPSFEVTISLPVQGGIINSTNSIALLDTGADIGQIPQRIIDELGLQPFKPVMVRYGDGVPRAGMAYAVNVIVAGVGSKIVAVVGSSWRDHVLLGRDFINDFILHLEHRNNFFELTN
jgi:predicted aspartyl protease